MHTSVRVSCVNSLSLPCVWFSVVKKQCSIRLEFAGPESLQCSRDTGKCKDSACLGDTKIALHK